jgi:hypothetical protein
MQSWNLPRYFKLAAKRAKVFTGADRLDLESVMDLLQILRSRVSALPEGNYTKGLSAVIKHIGVAVGHLERGHKDPDDTAFTDAIFRTNQAFEGSLKEAYRVLNAKDPAKETPNKIELYLKQQNVLRPRVLAQLTNYRTVWRNPSAHDYRLDFDEDEALLAIVTVSAFAIVLVDQITERISFNQAKEVASEQPSPSPRSEVLVDRVSDLIELFITQFNHTHANKTDIRGVEIVGALGGFLAVAAPELKADIRGPLLGDNGTGDFLITSGEQSLILEIKRAGPQLTTFARDQSAQQVLGYMEAYGIKQGILFFYSSPNYGGMIRSIQIVSHGLLAIVSTH